MNKRIYWIEGDGIGPEIWKAARPVIEAALAAENTGIKLEWTELLAGDKVFLYTQSHLPHAQDIQI